MNAFNDIAFLKTKTGSERNANGFRTDTYSTKQVFCEVRSATSSEFYAAYAVKLKVVKRIKLDVLDYESAILIVDNKRVKPSIVEINGEAFTIVRMYQTDDNQYELSLAEVE